MLIEGHRLSHIDERHPERGKERRREGERVGEEEREGEREHPHQQKDTGSLATRTTPSLFPHEIYGQ